MASAGSFVHGSGAGEGAREKSKEEQDIADFLSSIDDMTSAGTGSGGEVNLHGGGSSGGGRDVFLGSTTPPSQQQQQDIDGDAGELSAIADAFPADWLEGMEGLGLVGDQGGSSAQQPTPQQQPPPPPSPQDDQQQGDQPPQPAEEHGSNREPEILGEEPEILDDVEGSYDSGAAAAGMLMSAGGRVASWATRTPASLVGAATAALRGDARHTAGPSTAATTAARTSATEVEHEPPLDWPGALDMLGMTEAEAENDGSSAAATAPASELSSMPAPAAREETFPDFVEIRDPRNVSQFPKPDNALVAKVAAGARSGAAGNGQAGEAEGDGSGGAVAGQGTGKEQGPGQRHVLPAPLRTVEVYLRPDVTWESVSDVYMAVMLSRGLVVRQQTEKTVRYLLRDGALALNTDRLTCVSVLKSCGVGGCLSSVRDAACVGDC